MESCGLDEGRGLKGDKSSELRAQGSGQDKEEGA